MAPRDAASRLRGVDDSSLALKKLVERVLGKGADLPLAMLLELLVPVARLRELAREHGLTAKGGFRLEKAPAHVVAPLLAEQRDGKRLEAVLRLLLPPSPPAGGGSVAAVVEAGAAAGTAPAATAADALSVLRDAELARLRDELERTRESASRSRDRGADLSRRLQQAEQEVLLLRREVAHQKAASSDARGEPVRDDKDLLRRLHDLESEREGFLAADQALRRQLAHNQSRLRDVESQNAELEALLPKGRRRKKPPPEPPPGDDRRFLLPRFTSAFYKSLEGKERKGVERAIQAILLFCTEGHAYPGLEVKQLGGQDTWSLRASLGLRVYFRQLPEGDIELLELGDREDQHTTLRRLKERG